MDSIIRDVALELPIKEWIELEVDDNSKSEIEKLMRVYRLTNDIYDKRFESKENMIECLSRLLFEIEKKENEIPMENEISMMAKAISLVKGNLILRRGQIKSSVFIDPTDDYNQACMILNQNFVNDNHSFFDFMIHLNLGKYFRNMGMYYHRSDYYWRAFDEFCTLIEKIDNKTNEIDNESCINTSAKKALWLLYVWFEAVMNLIRTELYLYKLRETKMNLLCICDLICRKINENDNYNINYIIDKNYKEKYDKNEKDNNELINCLVKYKKENESKSSTIFLKTFDNLLKHINVDNKELNNEELLIFFKSYLTQALVQLGISYRKSRDYEIASNIFLFIIGCSDEKSYNVDALNNYAVCLRKRGNISILKEDTKEYIFIKKIKDEDISELSNENTKKLCRAILQCLIKGKNSLNEIKSEYYSIENQKEFFDKLFDEHFGRNYFATIEYIKTYIGDYNLSSNVKNKIYELISKLLSINPYDKNLILQKGLILQQNGNIEKSSKIFKSLYIDSPQIANGTIGLKAYYNLGCNLLSLKKYYEAKKYFDKICKEVKSNFSKEEISKEEIPEISGYLFHTVDLPAIDLLAKINYGFCLLNIGKYNEAKKEYISILDLYKNQDYRLGDINKYKIKNDLARCSLQLACKKDMAINEKNDHLSEAKKQLDDIIEHDIYNSEAFCYIGYYYYLLSSELYNKKEIIIDDYEKAINHFEKSLICNSNNVYANSGLISTIFKLYEYMKNIQSKDHLNDLSKRIKNKIKYLTGFYSIKSCSKIAYLIDNIESTIDINEKNTLFRALARINISKDEEGYSLFQNLKENVFFCSLDAVQRGKLLSVLFRIYEKILNIKKICRFYPQSSSDIVQYRSINRLKDYLSQDSDSKGKLSLWNTVYMNDYLEGETFIELMKKIDSKYSEETNEHNETINSNDRIELLNNIFCLNKSNDGNDELISNNENVYIASLTTKKDALPMWIPYADNAKGCTLSYSEEFLNLKEEDDNLTDVSSYSDSDYILYKVQYLSIKKIRECDFDHNDYSNTVNNIIDELKSILDLLDDSTLKNCLCTGVGNKEDEQSGEIKNKNAVDVIRRFIGSCLNEVRFLFKDTEYEHEDEVRIIHYSSEHQVDTKHFDVPRLYIVIDRDIQVEEVMLGPKIDNLRKSEITAWLYSTGKVNCVTNSERHYQ